MRRCLLVFLFILPIIVFGQRRNRYKWEFVGGVGVTNFLGAIGGSPDIGSHGIIGFKDWNWYSSRPVFTGGIRYKNTRHFAFKGALSCGWVYGSDSYTENIYRNHRNITFRSPIIELSAQVEYFPFKEAQGSLYRIKNSHGKRKILVQPYVFAGLGGFYFNPQGPYNEPGPNQGKWYNLRPLSTEGEGLPNGPKPYSQVAMSFPIGIGGKYALDRQWSIGMEIGLHYTTTDYIDDTHGVYYPNNVILANKGSVAAYFADPSLIKDSGTAAGQLRGYDSHYNDAYIFAVVNVNYKVMYRRRTRSKF